jgi:hypothetical protein
VYNQSNIIYPLIVIKAFNKQENVITPKAHEHKITSERSRIKTHNDKAVRQPTVQHGTQTLNYFIFVDYNYGSLNNKKQQYHIFDTLIF